MALRKFNLRSFSIIAVLAAFATAAPSPVDITPDKAVALVKRATCTPASASNSGVDDTPAIEAAIAACGAGGTIVIPSGMTYAIRSTVDFKGCTGCTFNIEGTLKASNDLDYWYYQSEIFLISGIKGATIQSLLGTGVIDGNGQNAYDVFATNSSLKRPALYSIKGGSTAITTKNIHMKNPPGIFIYAGGGSSNINFASLYMTAASKSINAPKNTDGFDVWDASFVTIADTTVSNQDDCVAFKAGCSYVTVTNIKCTGSHGLSVGSLGKTHGVVDIVKNIYVNGADMVTSAKAVGIKLYPSGPNHGSAIVSNVTWSNVIVDASDYAAQMGGCYGETDTYCASYPTTSQFSGIRLINFSGKTSAHYQPTTSEITCPAGGCDVVFSDYSVLSPLGTSKVICTTNGGTILGVTCSSP
ncbi:glycoside hydrolase family 28 protein [Cadophora sp. MPI-SDFR-AT-0126]|nr:glycoside hydrolase family 28 protein [Leotiomycetes sp. MPI-SDFR-AT-0126]